MSNIHPFTFACNRDAACLDLLLESAARLNDDRLASWLIFTDPQEQPSTEIAKTRLKHHAKLAHRLPDYSPWSEASAVSKIDGFGKVVSPKTGIKNSDWVVHIDSDCVFFDKRLFDFLENTDADFVGIDHSDRRVIKNFGTDPWTWTSGAFQAVRAYFAKRMSATFGMRFIRDDIYKNMREEGLSTVNDDVVVTFVAGLINAKRANVNGMAGVGDLAKAVEGDRQDLSMLHYAADRQTFFGVENCPKWEFPRVIEGALTEQLLTS